MYTKILVRMLLRNDICHLFFINLFIWSTILDKLIQNNWHQGSLFLRTLFPRTTKLLLGEKNWINFIKVHHRALGLLFMDQKYVFLSFMLVRIDIYLSYVHVCLSVCNRDLTTYTLPPPNFRSKLINYIYKFLLLPPMCNFLIYSFY